MKVLVFDFDGTLVESNQLKYDAYFDLFPGDAYHSGIVRQVLADSYEESRYVILEKILRLLGTKNEHVEEQVNMLAGQYNDIVLEGAKHCPECPGAEAVLRQLYQVYPLYLSSTTPEDALREILQFRKWRGYFQGIYGYPREKTETLYAILSRENVTPEQVLVVGDGESDRLSAAQVGCEFFDVNEYPLDIIANNIPNCQPGDLLEYRDENGEEDIPVLKN